MLDFPKTFEKYQQLVAEVDRGVEAIKTRFPSEVRCVQTCCDCCYAIFDLSLIEAVFLNYRFYEKTEKDQQPVILDRAERANRQAYRLKRRLQKLIDRASGEEGEVLATLSRERIQCPLLNQDRLCDLYEHRPITCRVYGVPTATEGKGHTCGLSGFQEGGVYPTIYLDRINRRLMELSREMLEEIGGASPMLDRQLVPLSAALLTDYDEGYFGI